MTMRLSHVLLALALAGMVLPPQAWAVSTVEGSDGTAGEAGNATLDASMFR